MLRLEKCQAFCRRDATRRLAARIGLLCEARTRSGITYNDVVVGRAPEFGLYGARANQRMIARDLRTAFMRRLQPGGSMRLVEVWLDRRRRSIRGPCRRLARIAELRHMPGHFGSDFVP